MDVTFELRELVKRWMDTFNRAIADGMSLGLLGKSAN
jgi:hypothetical protein